MSDLELLPDSAALMVVDVQKRLTAAMPEKRQANVRKNVATLLEAARRFEVPVVVSQQYPKGLGPTCVDIETAIEAVGDGVYRFDKTEFSVCRASPFAEIWDQIGSRRQWIVTGMECHVCVYQTVRDLLDRGATVFVPEDAVISRKKANWRRGLELMERAGAVITSTEVVVFDLLKKAGGDDFKALSALIR